ncbi:MAG: radical SAM protein [Candidatus Heimdallarchaeota archaeon]|nr:radical SAM protein [Candidatus Heimdallarchaeota archaeon]MCG3255139.1 radical SAM protein [Candidatus Heimdallarchaeota archaeon]MCK4610212.1 radical SAM protein [Candidatus Heimdallarchaeota archaeon]
MRRKNNPINRTVLNLATRYALKNPKKNIPKLISGVERFAANSIQKRTFKAFRDESNPMYKLLLYSFENINPKTMKLFVRNFGVNTVLVGIEKTRKISRENQCNVPIAILMDPTSACNLNCEGCWAAEYDKTDNLSFELMDRIILEGKDLGIYWYLYSGGEPTIRKNDLLKLAKKHQDCFFLAFTNGTLVDEEFAMALAEVGNLTLAISVEGFEAETDFRRGKGTYKKVIKAMKLLKKHRVLFGISTCYHNKNTHVIGSDEFIDYMIEMGASYGWLFTYMPLGKDAIIELMSTPEQREFMFHQVRKFRETKSIFLIDFWNDGDYARGCIAGGRSYLHINANGDVEPCAFIHYSNVNIKDVSLLESLKSPLFRQYNRKQPFNKNYLRPCPLLDNPDSLKEMVHESNAKSTQMIDNETVDYLTDKCQQASKDWAPVADRIRRESTKLSHFVDFKPPRYWDVDWDGTEELIEETNYESTKKEEQ